MKETFWRIIDGKKYIWNVTKLIEESKNLDVIDVSLEDIKELDESYWFNYTQRKPTIRNTVKHLKKVISADLSFPIILDPTGGLMDGGHRVAKALLEEHKTIKAVQFKEYPEPDTVIQGSSIHVGRNATPVKIGTHTTPDTPKK